MDDVRCAEDSYWCKHPTDAWVKSIHQGTITELACFGSIDLRRGLCAGHFLSGKNGVS